MGFWSVNLLGAAWGAVAFPLYAVAVAHANDYAEPEDYVMVSSGLLLMYGIGAIIGPFVASIFMSSVGAVGLFAFATIVHRPLHQRIALRTSTCVSTCRSWATDWGPTASYPSMKRNTL